MDEVWILSFCLTMLGFFVLVFSLRSKSEPELESVGKKASSSPASAYTSYGGKKLEMDENEVEKMMARLTGILYEAQEKDAPSPEKRKVASREASERAETPDTSAETQDPSGRLPAQAQPVRQPSRHRVQERSSPSAGVENIMDEIEQAVQETVEPEYHSRRRQQQAESRGKQWPEVTGPVETDSN